MENDFDVDDTRVINLDSEEWTDKPAKVEEPAKEDVP